MGRTEHTECRGDRNACSFLGAATSADVSHKFPLADTILTRVMSKHNHILIISLLPELLSSLGFSDCLLLFSIYLIGFPFAISFASSFSSPLLPSFQRALGLALGLLFTTYFRGKKQTNKQNIHIYIYLYSYTLLWEPSHK